MDEYAFDDDAKRRYPSSLPQRSEISPTPEAWAFLDDDDDIDYVTMMMSVKKSSVQIERECARVVFDSRLRLQSACRGIVR